MAEAAEYQVLARKWRPQRFDEVSGQEHVVRTLANAIAQGRVAHAYLFCGPRGVGKTTAARLLARALNCEKGPTPTPCGECSACKEIAAGTSVDVAEIDGASNNGVDDVRAIRENARYLPARDRHKIYIIDEVHMLSQAAFNALLKTLEEPPPRVKFIFATTEADKVPPTIVSRCQLHTFRRIPLSQLVARLRVVARAEGFDLSDEALALVARQAEGGMRDALSMLDQLVSSSGKNPSAEEVAEALGAVERRAIVSIVRALCRREAGELVRLLGEQHERGTEPRRICEALCRELHNLLVCRTTGTPPAELPDHEQKEVAELSAEAEPAHLARLFDLTHAALGELGRAFEPRLALDVALLKCIFLAPSVAIGELVARLEAVAGGGPIPPAPAKRIDPPPGPPKPAPGRATAPQSPTPAVGRDDASLPPAERVRSFVEAACGKAPRIGSALRNGRLRWLKPGELALAYPKGDFRASLLLGERAATEALLAAHFGSPTALRICEGEEADGEPSLAEREAKRVGDRGERIREEVLRSDAVRAAVDLLGGRVEEIRVLGEVGERK